jgi:polysaccharide export outer membrane protein
MSSSGNACRDFLANFIEFSSRNRFNPAAIMTTQSTSRRAAFYMFLVSLCSAVLILCACKSTPTVPPTAEDLNPPLLQLAPGDVVDITFAGATNMSGMHRIGPEGTINMPLVGQVEASGKSTEQLQSHLMAQYVNELKDTNIIVSLVGSGNVVYIDGAILRPGKMMLERPLTALEAIEEAGGFAETANKKKVTIIRYKGLTNSVIHLNLEPVLTGQHVPPFYLKPRDIIHVPTKVQWF